MKRFICWYAYKGMETEGQLFLEEPQIVHAIDMAEAMWKWHHTRDPKWGKKFYNNDIEIYRKQGEFTGWGCWCEELVAFNQSACDAIFEKASEIDDID